MGAKGIRTRQRLIAHAVELLDSKQLRQLTVKDIARRAKTSAATFYLYFDDVPAVILAAIEEMPQSTAEILSLVREDWNADRAPLLARRLVDAYFKFWEEHRTLFRVRNLAAEEGDLRFRAARTQSVRQLLEAMACQVEAAQRSGCVDAKLHPRSLAGALIALLERLGAIFQTYSGQEGISGETLAASAAYILATCLALRDPAGSPQRKRPS